MKTTSRVRGWLLSLIFVGGSVCAQAAVPPTITGISPYGAPRGSATEITISGANLEGDPALIAPFGFKIEPSEAGQSDAANWRFRITVDPATAVGTHVVRMRSNTGISNPFLFAVGQLPQVAETEPNNAFDGAQAVTLPVVVEGQSAGADIDFFKFAGKKGQKIVVDAQCARIGSGVDPMIRLTTAQRKFVASAEDSPGLLLDARLMAELPEDGDYVIEISDSKYTGGGRAIYRLTIGEIPVADEVFPLGGRRGETVGFELRGDLGNGDRDKPRITAQTLIRSPHNPFDSILLKAVAPDLPHDIETLASLEISDLPEHREPIDPQAPPLRTLAPAVFNGRLETPGDEDRYIVAVTPEQTYHFAIHAANLGSAIDGELKLLNPAGAELAKGDDTTIQLEGKGDAKPPPFISPDPSLDFKIPKGITEVTLVVSDLQGRGGVGFPYRLIVEPKPTAFELKTTNAEISIPQGGDAIVGVSVKRQGYNGPIEVTLANPPEGLTVRPGKIADGQTAGGFSISAAPDATIDYAVLNVVGKGNDNLVVASSADLTFATQGTMPTNTTSQTGFIASTAKPALITIEAAADVIEVAHGGSVKIPIKIHRQPNGEGDLAFAALPLPPGVTAPELKVGAKDAEGALTVSAAPPAPLAVMSLGWTAKGKIENADRVFSVPVIAIQVVQPVSLTLSAPSFEVKPGETVEVKGKVERKGGFAQPVDVKITDLPAGVKLEPEKATVAADASEFVFKVVADASAAPAVVKPKAAIALQIDKKDYAVPPVEFEFKVVQ